MGDKTQELKAFLVRILLIRGDDPFIVLPCDRVHFLSLLVCPPHVDVFQVDFHAEFVSPIPFATLSIAFSL